MKICKRMVQQSLEWIRHSPKKRLHLLRKGVFLCHKKGALTLEASIIMTLVIVVILSISMFMRVVQVHGVMQHALLEVGQELGKFSYITTVEEMGKIEEIFQHTLTDENFDQVNSNNQISFLESLKRESKGILKEKLFLEPMIQKMMQESFFVKGKEEFDQRLKDHHIMNGIEGLDFRGSKILEDEENITLVLRYRIKYPLPIPLLGEIPLRHRVHVRAWLKGERWSGFNGQDPMIGEEYVWHTNPKTRGREIHQQLGQNLPYFFPTIDQFDQGKVTAMLSIDLTAPTYQKMSHLKRVIQNEIDEVARFEGASVQNTQILPEDIIKREVLIIFPKPVQLVTAEVRNLLYACEDYAKERGVAFSYKHFGVLQNSEVHKKQMTEER